ncbi:MAG TPA: adenylate/guanylate cyclase domain-containing protein [Actinomycetota bacterium]
METKQRGGSAGLPAAHDALDAHRWKEAFDLLSQADRQGSLEPEDLEALAQAAWFTAQADLAVEAKERAFKAHLDRGNRSRAAALAFDIGHDYVMKQKRSIASAWSGRGERLLEGEPESFAHGYLALSQSWGAKAAGDIDRAVDLAARAVELGARFGDLDLQAWALLQQGSLLITIGRTDEGFPLMEEATIAAVNGELSPLTAGVAYCSMIAACRDTTDYRRASEWTEAAHRWCERQAINGFPGVCRVHRAEILALQGGLDRAELELQQATQELAAYNTTPPLADGFYALGEIRLRLGDLEGAEEALRQAHALGRVPQPALALIRLHEGKVRAAFSAISSALAEAPRDRWARARMLPAQVEIAIAAGDPATARAAAEEISGITEANGSPALHASKHDALGRVHLAEGEPEGAIRELRTAMRHWQEVGAPYEVARDRVVLASALRELDQHDEANLELEAAKGEFERLGAIRDVVAAAEAIRAAAERDAAPLTTRKAFVFTDIVSSTNLAEAMGDEAWEHLLRWHDDTLRSLFARHGGEVVNRTGDGFFVAFDSSGKAIECAVGVQRALAEQRRTHGFAPAVRVGVHAAEANRRGSDYSGKGVHVAARIAALADGGQVLVSAETAAEAGGSYATSEPRAVALKGVSGEVEVVSVSWS